MKTVIPIAIILSLAITLIPACTREEDSPAELITRTLFEDISSDSLESYVRWMEGMGTRFCLADNHRNIAEKIRKKLISFGYSEAKLDSFKITGTFRETYPYDQWQYNVIAALEGLSDPDSLCILGGHYDNILKASEGDPFQQAYGANDNASGVAAMLEIARVMKLNNYSPRNSVVFIAFAAEELGLFGSHSWANSARLNNLKIKMMLNNDMIAYQQTPSQTSWVVDILDYDNSRDLSEKAREFTKYYTSLSSVNDNTYNRQSDSYPFFLNGFPAIFFYGYSPDPNYHTRNDVSSQCNFEFCREIVKISCALLVNANTP